MKKSSVALIVILLAACDRHKEGITSASDPNAKHGKTIPSPVVGARPAWEVRVHDLLENPVNPSQRNQGLVEELEKLQTYGEVLEFAKMVYGVRGDSESSVWGGVWEDVKIKMATLDPESAMEFFKANKQDARYVFQHWLWNTPEEKWKSLFEGLQDKPLSEDTRNFIIKQNMRGWAQGMPKDCVDYLKSHSNDKFYDGALADSVHALTQSVPTEVPALLAQMQDSKLKTAAYSAHGYRMMWMADANGTHEKRMAMLNSLPKDQWGSIAMAGAYRLLLEKQPDFAIANLASITDPVAFDYILLENLELLDKKMKPADFEPLLSKMTSPEAQREMEKKMGYKPGEVFRNP